MAPPTLTPRTPRYTPPNSILSKPNDETDLSVDKNVVIIGSKQVGKTSFVRSLRLLDEVKHWIDNTPSPSGSTKSSLKKRDDISTINNVKEIKPEAIDDIEGSASSIMMNGSIYSPRRKNTSPELPQQSKIANLLSHFRSSAVTNQQTLTPEAIPSQGIYIAKNRKSASTSNLPDLSVPTIMTTSVSPMKSPRNLDGKTNSTWEAPYYIYVLQSFVHHLELEILLHFYHPSKVSKFVFPPPLKKLIQYSDDQDLDIREGMLY